MELAWQVRSLPEGSPEQRELQQRIRELDSYREPMYEKPKEEQERLILSHAQFLIASIFSGRSRLSTWEEVKEGTDKYAKEIRTRPVGRQPRYRHRIAEALDLYLAHPDRTWRKIYDDLHLDIPFDHFTRQVTLLRNLLKEEQIPFTHRKKIAQAPE